MAEGAIEGTAGMYEVASPFATAFAFSRFGGAELVRPAGGLSLLAAGAEATSTERESKDFFAFAITSRCSCSATSERRRSR